jgi:enoyl-CoA hydratase/carnithine racemase
MSDTPNTPNTDIQTHTEAGVTTITLNRISRKNSITAGMYAAMADALVVAAADASVRVVVF